MRLDYSLGKICPIDGKIYGTRMSVMHNTGATDMYVSVNAGHWLLIP